MDDLTIGLDFGTHQTKVCIEDASDGRNIKYTFFEFDKGNGEKTFFLPSLVQLNDDDTLSYGFCDEARAKVIGREHSYSEPILKLPAEPLYSTIGREPGYREIIPFENYLKELQRGPTIYETRKKKEVVKKRKKGRLREVEVIHEERVPVNIVSYARAHYEEFLRKSPVRESSDHIRWRIFSEQIKADNERRRRSWEAECVAAREEFDRKHRLWEESYTDVKAIYRYFKIATFSQRYNWKADIDPKTLSAWFITYVMFCIYNSVDELSPVQMGIPQSICDTRLSRWQIDNAESIFYQALELYRHYGSREKFMAAKVQELKAMTSFKRYDVDYERDPGMMALPEAFAGLVSITKEGKISPGLTLLLDIGGGSTDISLFNVIKKSSRSTKEYMPNISHIISYHHGLNHVFRMYSDDHDGMSLEDVKGKFWHDRTILNPYIEEFEKGIVRLVDKEIYCQLMDSIKRCGGDGREFSFTLMKRPVIFSGGGGVLPEFQHSVHVFQEPLSVSSDLLSLKNITNKNITDDELSILAVAHGLSIPQMKEPEMIPLDQLFANIRIEQGITRHGYEDGKELV